MIATVKVATLKEALDALCTRRRWYERRQKNVPAIVAAAISELEAVLTAASAPRPCTACRSTELCEPDCRLAPWKLDDVEIDVDD